MPASHESAPESSLLSGKSSGVSRGAAISLLPGSLLPGCAKCHTTVSDGEGVFEKFGSYNQWVKRAKAECGHDLQLEFALSWLRRVSHHHPAPSAAPFSFRSRLTYLPPPTRWPASVNNGIMKDKLSKIGRTRSVAAEEGHRPPASFDGRRDSGAASHADRPKAEGNHSLRSRPSTYPSQPTVRLKDALLPAVRR